MTPDFLLNLTPHEYAIAGTSFFFGIAATALLFLVLYGIEEAFSRRSSKPLPAVDYGEFVALTKIVVDGINGFNERLDEIFVQALPEREPTPVKTPAEIAAALKAYGAVERNPVARKKPRGKPRGRK